MGLHQAWPDVEIVGVDINPQPRYPFKFVQADALTYPVDGFDFIWASPPCQAYTVARNIQKREHPKLVEPIRAKLKASGAAYCIENVPGAPLINPITLCGTSFGLEVEVLGIIYELRRHRLFETNFSAFAPPPFSFKAGNRSLRPRRKQADARQARVSNKPSRASAQCDANAVGQSRRNSSSHPSRLFQMDRPAVRGDHPPPAGQHQQHGQDPSMKLIDLSTKTYPNTFAMVDDEDFDFLNQWKWYPDSGVYAARTVIQPRKMKIFMHREIAGRIPGTDADHINGNTLDNRRENLRLCTHAENGRNRKKSRGKTSSQYKGVCWNKRERKYRAAIQINKKSKTLGLFRNEEEAALAYNRAAILYHGQFARLNPVNCSIVEPAVVPLFSTAFRFQSQPKENS